MKVQLSSLPILFILVFNGLFGNCKEYPMLWSLKEFSHLHKKTSLEHSDIEKLKTSKDKFLD